MLSLFTKWAERRKRKYIEGYIEILTRTIINEAETQTLHIVNAVTLVRSGGSNSITLRKNGTRVRRVGKSVEIEIYRDKLVLTSQDIIARVMKELDGTSISQDSPKGFITDAIRKELYNNPAVTSGSLLVMLSSLLKENTIIKEMKNV